MGRPLKVKLFPFQRTGVAFIEQKKGRVLIADEMGLGKTIQSLAWLHLHPELRPAIVVCPAHLKLNWAKEVKKVLPGKQNVQILYGEKGGPSITGDIIIINYDILPNKYEKYRDKLGKKKVREIKDTGWVDFLIARKPKVLILDEAHYIKTNSAQRTKATKKLAKKRDHVIAISGTPMDRPIDGFNLFQVIDKNIFPDFWKYVHRYCGAKHNGFGWDYSGASNEKELHNILTKTIMIRRKKSEVLPELPDKIYSYVPMELINRKKYEKAENDFISYLREEKGRGAVKKAVLAEHLVKIEALKQLALEGKLAQCIEWINAFIEKDNSEGKLIVFTTHKSTVETLMDEFKKIAVKVDGSCSAKGRDQAVQAFQEDPKIRLFIGNIQAAGTGLTLTAATAIAFLELPWTPGALVQAEDRPHRIGQKNAVNIYHLLAANTIEEKIAKILDKKKKTLDIILDGEGNVVQTGVISELINSFIKVFNSL